MPPDYIASLQHVMEPALPHATPADHSRYLSDLSKRGMTRDKTASAACTCLLASAFLYNVTILWRLLYPKTPNDCPPGWTVSNVVATSTTSVCWVLAHVLMELAFMCWVSREPAMYKRHRSGCIMVTRTGLLVLMLFYIPKTYDHTLAIEVHTGRAAAATLRLVTGFVAIHILELLCFRLPTKLAVPYHTARVAFSLAVLPTTLKAFARNPAVTAVACELWEQIGQLFLAAASWVLGAPLKPFELNTNPDLGRDTVLSTSAADLASRQFAQSAEQLAPNLADGSQGLCTAALLLLFLNISLGLLVPLYVLYVWEVADFRAFLLAGDRHTSSGSNSSNASSSRSLGSILAPSSSSVTSGFLEQQQQHVEGQQTEAAAGSNGVHAGAAAAAGGTTPSLAAATRPASGGSSSLPRSSLLQAALAARGGAAPIAAAATAAPADAAAAADAPASSMGDPAAGPAAGSSGDECGPLAAIWPVHFSVPLHALVLFCLTGVVWAVFDAAWGIWQHKYGAGSCSASWLV